MTGDQLCRMCRVCKCDELNPGVIRVDFINGSILFDEIEPSESYGHTNFGWQYVSRLSRNKVLISPFGTRTIHYRDPK